MYFENLRLNMYHFLFSQLKKLDISIKDKDIFEYGSLDFVEKGPKNLKNEISLFFNYYNLDNVEEKINKLEEKGRLRLKDILFEFGANYVIGADGDGFECVPLDFNKSIAREFNRQFDLIFNCGTSEHIFNIAQSFEDLHYLCKEDGIIIYSLPVKGYMNHGYYTIHPKLFFDLAESNCYETLGVFKQIIYSKNHSEFQETDIPLQSYSIGSKEVFEEENVNLIVFFRKLTNNKFNSPYEKVYSNTANSNVIKVYNNFSIDCFLKKNKLSQSTPVAIFGTKRAAEIAYEFCKKHSLNISIIIDDFESGRFHGIEIISKEKFIRSYENSINTVFVGSEQKGLDDKFFLNMNVLKVKK